MKKVTTIIIYLAIIALIGWLIIRVFNAEDNAKTNSNSFIEAEQKANVFERKADSLIYVIDSIINNKKIIDSTLKVVILQRNKFKIQLNEKRNNIINDSDRVIPFVKNYLSNFEARQY